MIFFSNHIKGQVISKRFLGSSISSKKRTNEFVFTAMQCVFVRFWKKLKTPKKIFRNYMTFSFRFYSITITRDVAESKVETIILNPLDLNSDAKGQLISKGHFGFFNSPKKRTKNFCPSRLGQKFEFSSSFFWRIGDSKDILK